MIDTALVLCSLPAWALLIAYTLRTALRRRRQRRAVAENRAIIERARREAVERYQEADDQ